MAPLYFLGEDDQNEVKHDFFGFWSCDTEFGANGVTQSSDGIRNGTITFLRSK